MGLVMVPLDLYAGSDEVGVGHTVFMGKSNIGASIALSHASIGWDDDSAGYLGGIIIWYKQSATGDTKHAVPTAWTSNCWFVNDCTAIKFGLGGRLAAGTAVAHIFFF